jgi:hypothetical protein
MEAPPVPVKPKKKASEAQLANLRKGFEALQAKRKALAEKDNEPPVPPPAPAPVEPPPPPPPAPEPAVAPAPVSQGLDPKPKVKKERKPKAPAFDPDSFRNSLLADLRSGQTERIVERPIEKEKVVFKDRVVSGSELLNRIFGFD